LFLSISFCVLKKLISNELAFAHSILISIEPLLSCSLPPPRQPNYPPYVCIFPLSLMLQRCEYLVNNCSCVGVSVWVPVPYLFRIKMQSAICICILAHMCADIQRFNGLLKCICLHYFTLPFG